MRGSPRRGHVSPEGGQVPPQALIEGPLRLLQNPPGIPWARRMRRGTTEVSRMENGRQGTRPGSEESILELARSLCIEVRSQDASAAAERACLLDVTVGDLRCVVLRRPS